MTRFRFLTDNIEKMIHDLDVKYRDLQVQTEEWDAISEYMEKNVFKKDGNEVG